MLQYESIISIKQRWYVIRMLRDGFFLLQPPFLIVHCNGKVPRIFGFSHVPWRVVQVQVVAPNLNVFFFAVFNVNTVLWWILMLCFVWCGSAVVPLFLPTCPSLTGNILSGMRHALPLLRPSRAGICPLESASVKHLHHILFPPNWWWDLVSKRCILALCVDAAQGTPATSRCLDISFTAAGCCSHTR